MIAATSSHAHWAMLAARLARGDPVLCLPGVSDTPETSSLFFIRSGSTDDPLIKESAALRDSVGWKLLRSIELLLLSSVEVESGKNPHQNSVYKLLLRKLNV